MKQRSKIFALGLIILSLACFGLAGKIYFFDKPPVEQASLRTDVFPVSKVFLNDKEVGVSPYLAENLTPGEYKIKVVPVGLVTGSFDLWEAKIKLNPGTLTYVSRNLGPTDELSGGQILTLEKLPIAASKELALVSDPDGATITVDNQAEGFTPTILHNLSAGDHEIVVKAPGYYDQVVHGRMVAGFRLNVLVKLAKKSETTSLPVATPSSELAKPYVIIKPTETGFLRLRMEANLVSSVTAQLKPGEKYPILQELSGWVKLKLASMSGWVSDRYVEKVK